MVPPEVPPVLRRLRLCTRGRCRRLRPSHAVA